MYFNKWVKNEAKFSNRTNLIFHYTLICRSIHCYTYNSSIFYIVAVDDKAAVIFSSIIDAIKSITVNHTIAKCLN